MTIRNDADAVEFLDGLINYEKLLAGGVVYDTKSFDLENFRALLTDLGDPQGRYAVIHVAGTKGKGSTCAFLASILRQAGLRTGLYTSPHIEHYRERIAVDGQAIPEAQFCELLTRLARRVESRGGASSTSFRTVFEILTAAAFLHFSQENVDIAVIETGLGGRLDATNVFDQAEDAAAPPLVNVITAIGLDHQAILGDTVERIAAEKAGIIRPHAVTVLGPQPPAWVETVRDIVREKCVLSTTQTEMIRVGPGGSPPRLLDSDRVIRCEPETADAAFFACVNNPHVCRYSRLADELLRGMRLVSPLPGLHQLGNLRTVLTALIGLEIASGGRRHVGVESVRTGVLGTRWPGRFEILSPEPLVIVDGAHCLLSAQALADTFSELFGNREILAVAGFMRDKMAVDICRVARGRLNITGAVACAPPSPRSLPADRAADVMRQTLGVPVLVEEDPGRAVATALVRRTGNAAVVVFGSMFVVGPARAALGIR